MCIVQLHGSAIFKGKVVGEGLLVLGMHKVKKLWMEIASGQSPLRWMAVRIIRRITIQGWIVWIQNLIRLRTQTSSQGCLQGRPDIKVCYN